MSNPFWEAVQPSGDAPKTRHVEPEPFFRDAVKANKLKKQARNMSRQEMFNNGFLTVEDMDDEELRAGRMRDNLGRIPKVTKTMEQIPRDLYDAMVAEHQQRTQEKYRQQMDAALETIVGIMTDPAVEPKDRLQAATHVKEQVMGKTPERVQVAVSRAPWEDIAMDVGRLTRAEHEARRRGIEQGVIDAEVVREDTELPEHTDLAVEHEDRRGDSVGPGVRDGQRANMAADGDPNNNGGIGDPRITAAEPTPTHDNPACSDGVLSVHTPSNSELIRWDACDAQEIAARRKQFRERIEQAKKRRKAMRMSGADVVSRRTITTALLMAPGDPDTGKLRHTLDTGD